MNENLFSSTELVKLTGYDLMTINTMSASGVIKAEKPSTQKGKPAYYSEATAITLSIMKELEADSVDRITRVKAKELTRMILDSSDSTVIVVGKNTTRAFLLGDDLARIGKDFREPIATMIYVSKYRLAYKRAIERLEEAE